MDSLQRCKKLIQLNISRNNIRNIDSTEVARAYSTIAAFTLVFTDDRLPSAGKFTIFDRFTHGFESSQAVIDGDDNTLEDITITALSMPFTFSYSTYTTGGHTPNTPLPIRVAVSAPGLIEAEDFDFTIVSSTTQEYRCVTTPDPSYVA